jgi:hypothetical protein
MNKHGWEIPHDLKQRPAVQYRSDCSGADAPVFALTAVEKVLKDSLGIPLCHEHAQAAQDL